MFREKSKQLMISYQMVFGSEDGKAVLADLRKMAPMIDAPVGPTDSLDTNRMFLLRGRSDVIVKIYQMLKKDPYLEREEHAIGKGE